jgi:type IV pilus assembly protein PilW
MQKLRGRSPEAGITLVELLVAMAIGLILAGGIFQVFVGSSDSYQLNTQLSRLQENGRFAMQVMRQEARGAGYLGCAQDASPTKFTNTLNNNEGFLYDFSNAIFGLEAGGGNWTDNTGATYSQAQVASAFDIEDALDGSDILVVRGSSAGDITLYAEMPPTSAVLKVTDADKVLNQFDIVMVSDCEHASVFQVTQIQSNGTLVHNTGLGDPGNATKDLGREYGEGAEIVRMRSAVFYVRQNPNGQPALYLKNGLADAVELVEGVEMMQVRYGEDTNNDGTVDAYVDAGNVGDWDNVRSVRIGLLLRTVAEIGRGPFDNQTYDVSGDGNDDFGPAGDRRLRLVMSGTVGLRNRLR